MKIENIRRMLGKHLLLVLFCSTLFSGLAANILQANAAYAWNSDGIKATWITANTIYLKSTDNRTIVFTQVSPSYASDYKKCQGSIESNAKNCTLPDAGEYIAPSADTVLFTSQTLGSYLSPHNPLGNFSNDTDVCNGGDTNYSANFGMLEVQKSTIDATRAQGQTLIKKWGIWHVCGASNYSPVTFQNQRPPVPTCGPDSNNPGSPCQGSVAWATNNPYIVNYSGQDRKDDGIINGQEFDISKLDGKIMTLTSVSPSTTAGCTDLHSYVVIDPYDTARSAHLFIPQYVKFSQSGCEMVDGGWLSISNNYPSAPKTDPNYSATWLTTDSIQLSGIDTQLFDWGVESTLGQGPVFSRSDLTNNAMTLTADDQCTVNNSNMVANPYLVTKWVSVIIYDKACVGHRLNVALTNVNSDSTIVETGGNTDNGTDNTLECPVNDPVMGWILCPIFDLAKGAVQKLTDSINAILFFNTDQLFGTNSSFQNSYNVFRNVGLSLLVVAGLVMVVSQAAGLEIFSAYTIRKMLPRLVLAAIGISLAWPILQFVITFFNDLGGWISDIILMAAPQSGAGNGYTNILSAVLSILFGVAATGAAILGGLDMLGLLSLVLTIALGLLLGYVVLVIRLMVIVVCIVIAPLAIAASVMPGTEKLWKFWRETLMGALLMYPIVMAFLSAGAALAAVAASLGKTASTGPSFVLDFIAVIAYFIPFFLIPMAFRMASGLMGNVFGMISDRSKGLFEGMRKQRAGWRAQKRQDVRNGSRFNKDSAWTKALGGNVINRIGSHAGAGFRGRFGLGAVGQAARASNMMMTHDNAMKAIPYYAQNSNDEAFLAALATGNNRRMMEDLGMKAAEIDRGLNAARNVQATQQARTAALDGLARSGKIIQNREGLDMLLSSVAGGNTALKGGLKGNYQYTSRQVGREDIGRDTDYASIKEMDIASVARQKPQSLENLFGVRTDANGNATASFIQAMREAQAAGNPAEMQHIVDVAYAAQYNASLSPEQQQSVRDGLALLVNKTTPVTFGVKSGTDYFRQAAANYKSKIVSDRRLKKDIIHLLTLPNGIRIYRFTYQWGGPECVGVMAQDLLLTHPEAVSTDEFGYHTVDYSALGLRMIRFSEWQHRPELVFLHHNDTVRTV